MGCSVTREVELIQDENVDVYVGYYPNFGLSDSMLVYAYLKTDDSLNLQGNENFTNYTWSTGQTGNEIKVTESGTYCVTVTAYDNCEFSGCVDVEFTTTDEVPKITGCDDNIQYINVPGKCEFTTQTGMVYQADSIFEINVLIDGYYFYSIFLDGSSPILVNIPCIRAEGATPDGSVIIVDDIVNTSCETCNDGKINYHFDDSEAGYILGSEFGYMAIYAEDDLETNLSETNDKGELNSGTYYIVVHDKNTDCYIAHEKVIVE